MKISECLAAFAILLVCQLMAAEGGGAKTAKCLAASVFSDHMVLQRGIKIPVFGDADDGEIVKVELNGQTVSVAAKDGKWRAYLPAMEAGGPYVMTVEGKSKQEFKDVMIGDVWVCSGQSNMNFPAVETVDWGGAIKPELPRKDIRHFQPRESDKGWRLATEEAAKTFTGVGYYFARDIQADQKVTIGLINSSQDCTSVAMWITKEKAASLGYDSDKDPKMIKFIPEFEKCHKVYIRPIQPYAIKGALWYQGESDGNPPEYWNYYEKLFPGLIESWRAEWGQGDFPFLIVQLPGHPNIIPESHRKGLLLRNTGVVAIADTFDGHENEGHCRNKKPVGERLALAARAVAYGEKIEYMGPTIESAKIEGEKVVLTFSHADGLNAKNGTLKAFQIQWPGKTVSNPPAEIESNRITLSAPGIFGKVTIRYENTPKDARLYNSAGLLAPTFQIEIK